jgi:hypothetical protein
MNAEKFVVMTTVNRPGKAAARFAQWEDWQTVVIGDRKTPEPWECEGATYIGLDGQHEICGEFSGAVPEGSYARKMIGYVFAMRNGATAIFDTDDDNVPYLAATGIIETELWDHGCRLHYEGRRPGIGQRWLNVYGLFGASHCWPRGFPPECVKGFGYRIERRCENRYRAVVQFLVDGEPDTDAIYRLTNGKPVNFERGRGYVLDYDVYCSINSQATLWKPEAFPLMFLPVGVSDRVTDILRGYIAQVAIHKTGDVIGYHSPIVFQVRNPHDLLKDFEEELPLYRNASRWMDALLELPGESRISLFRAALRKLVEIGAIPELNVGLYEMFLKVAGIEV